MHLFISIIQVTLNIINWINVQTVEHSYMLHLYYTVYYFYFDAYLTERLLGYFHHCRPLGKGDMCQKHPPSCFYIIDQ